MKFGIYYAYWEKNWYADYPLYVRKAARLGYDVLEISCGGIARMTPDDLAALRECAASSGIVLTAGYGPAADENLSSADPETVRNGFRFWESMLASLEILGITTVGGGLYSYWPVDFGRPPSKSADRKRAIQNMRLLADMALTRGITVLGMEVLNRFEGYILNTAEEGIAFVDEVNRPNVKVMLDTFHMNIEEDDMIAAVLSTRGRLGHFHAGERNRRTPGTGDLPWSRIGEALQQIGYDGCVVSEPFVLQGGRVGNDIKVWRDVLPEPTEAKLDAAAAASVAFLRQAFGGQA